MPLPSLPTIYVPRWALDAIRFIQFAVVLAFLTLDLGSFEGYGETITGALTIVVGSLVVRQATTPSASPQAADGRGLYPNTPAP